MPDQPERVLLVDPRDPDLVDVVQVVPIQAGDVTLEIEELTEPSVIFDACRTKMDGTQCGEMVTFTNGKARAAPVPSPNLNSNCIMGSAFK